MPGPKLHITSPYIGDYLGLAPQLHALSGPEDAGRTVDYWADEGVTSFKAYMAIKSDELKVAIEHAHARGLKITGHLCAVGFREAAALGIDNLEHGIVVDTEFYPGKKSDICPAREAEEDFAKRLDIDSAPVKEMIPRPGCASRLPSHRRWLFLKPRWRTDRRCSNKPELKKPHSRGLVELSAKAQRHSREEQSLDARSSIKRCSSSGLLSKPADSCWRAAIRPDSAVC